MPTCRTEARTTLKEAQRAVTLGSRGCEATDSGPQKRMRPDGPTLLKNSRAPLDHNPCGQCASTPRPNQHQRHKPTTPKIKSPGCHRSTAHGVPVPRAHHAGRCPRTQTKAINTKPQSHEDPRRDPLTFIAHVQTARLPCFKGPKDRPLWVAVVVRPRTTASTKHPRPDGPTHLKSSPTAPPPFRVSRFVIPSFAHWNLIRH